MVRGLVVLLLSILSWQAMAFKSAIDDGGYYYIDSDEPGFAYNFEDISLDEGSTLIPLTGDDSETINIGFPFEFYGTNYSNFFLTSKTVISFTKNNHNYSPEGIPSSGAYSKLGSSILGWWGDLNPSFTGGSVHTRIKGSAPNRRLIIQFTNTQIWGGGGNITLQFKLFESSNDIEVHYKHLYGNGADYTIGILKDASIGQQVWFGSGNSIQNAQPPFSTPHAIKYIFQPTISPTENSEKLLVRTGLGITQNQNLELENTFNSNMDVELEYLTTNGLVATVTGPSSATVNANSALSIPFNSTILEGDDLKDNNIIIRVSSVDASFETFDIAVQVVVVELDQLTPDNFTTSTLPNSSYDGKKVLLKSTDDLANTMKLNSINAMFVYDVVTDSYQQLTPNYVGYFCYGMAISGDGKWAAAVCDGDFDTETGRSNSGPSKSKEVFLYDLENGGITQIADDMNAHTDFNNLALDYTGETLLLISDTDLAGMNNGSQYEVFSYSRSGDVFIQLSDFDAGTQVYGVDLDYRGERFVTSAASNVFDTNPSGNIQVFTGSTKTGILKQVTVDDNFDSGFAKISANGEFLTFSSYAPLLGGASGIGNVYVADFETASLDQITNSAVLDSGYSDISADGSRVVFVSKESLNGDNLASNGDVFMFSRLTGSISQLTELNNASKNVLVMSYAADGSIVYFSGSGDWVSGENTRNMTQVFTVSGLSENAVIPSPKKVRVEEEYEEGLGVKRTKKELIEESAGYISFAWIWSFVLLAIFTRSRKVSRHQ